MARVRKAGKLELEKRIKKSFRRGENLLCFAVDYGKELGVVGCFYPKMSSKARRAEIDRVVNVNKHSLRSYQLSVSSTLAEFDFGTDVDYFSWSPASTLAVLLDTSQFKRGKGGKSLNAIVRSLGFDQTSPLYAEACRDVKRNLSTLIEMGLVVRAITGTYWPKEWFREVMRAQGISFLPTVR